MLSGEIASAGIGIGSAIIVKQYDLGVTRRCGMSRKKEKQRFVDAVGEFTAEIHKAAAVLREMAGEKEALILDFQIAVINDPELWEELEHTLDKDHVNLEYAFCKVCDHFIGLMLSLEDELFRARAADIHDVKIHMLSILMGIRRIDLSLIPSGSVIVSYDIAPSCTAYIDPKKIRAIVTQSGATCSHTAMISKAMGVPTLVSVGGLLDQVRDGDTLIVDGEVGGIVHNPEPKLLADYRKRYA